MLAKSVKIFILITIVSSVFVSCSTASKTVYKGYGYSPKDPVLVGGGFEDRKGRKNAENFLNALVGPNGENVSWQRSGSCCEFTTPNGYQGKALLDVYVIKIEGMEEYIQIYINLYDEGELKSPAGLVYKSAQRFEN